MTLDSHSDQTLRVMTELSLDDFAQMELLERQFYDPQFITPYTESYQWYEHDPATIVALHADGRIVGFMNMLSVKPTIYDLLLRGFFNDSDMTVADLAALDHTAEEAYFFLSCVVVDTAYRKSAALGVMLHHYMEKLDVLSRSGVTIHPIVMDTVTEAGSRFAVRLGMEYLGKSDHHSHLYFGAYDRVKSHSLKIICQSLKDDS